MLEQPLALVIILLLVGSAGSLLGIFGCLSAGGDKFFDAALLKERPKAWGQAAATGDVVVAYYLPRIFLCCSGGLILIWTFFAFTR